MSPSDCYVVWIHGANGAASTIMGVYSDRDHAIDLALALTDQTGTDAADPGDTVIVNGFVLDDGNVDAEDVWRNR